MLVRKDMVLDTEQAFDERSVFGHPILCESLDNIIEYWWNALHFQRRNDRGQLFNIYYALDTVKYIHTKITQLVKWQDQYLNCDSA